MTSIIDNISNLEILEFMNELNNRIILGDTSYSIHDSVICKCPILRKNIRRILKGRLGSSDKFRLTYVYERFGGTEYRQDFEKKVTLMTRQFIHWKIEKQREYDQLLEEVSLEIDREKSQKQEESEYINMMREIISNICP